MEGGENMRWTLGEVIEFLIGAAITVGVATLEHKTGSDSLPFR